MENKYDNLRPEKADDFNLHDFKSTVLSLTDFSDQLDFWNKYFDLPAMGRRLSVDIGYNIIFHFYCESPQCAKNFTPERQAILIEWRKKYYKPFQATFDQLTTYQERIDFCLKHFGTALNTFVPEEGIIFSTMPETPDEWEIYNRLSYESWEKHLFETPSLKDKSFAIRKEVFIERIINHLHPVKGLQDEINTIYEEYFQPGKKWSQETEHFNSHIKTFRDRYNGFVVNFAEEPKKQRGFSEMVKYIEGEQAYKYYKYLVELQRMPDWFEVLKEKIAPVLSTPPKVTTEPSYDADRLMVDRSYQFTMIDQFMEYMDTVESFTERAQYFMKICKALGLSIPTLNMGTQRIFERDHWTTDQGEALSFLDREGRPVPYKLWGLTSTTDEERRISRKLWFLEQRHVKFKTFGHWVNESLEQRKEHYYKQLSNYNPFNLCHLLLNSISDEITRFHNDHNKFCEKSGLSETDEVKQQRLMAPSLIESELLGKRAINWSAFYRDYHLQSFAFLWEMIEFRLFLIRQLSLSQPTLIPISAAQVTSTSPDMPELANNTPKIEPLSRACICLIRIYEQNPITKTNASEVAAEYGHTNPYAGKSLLRKYDELDNANHRLQHRDIERDIMAVKDLLSEKAKEAAENELIKIKNKRR